MKTLRFYALIGTVALAMVFVSCSKDEAVSPMYSASNGSSKVLNEAEKEGLITLLETQKLQRDVYALMAANNQQTVFAEMYQRDAQLMELLSIKVDKYGLVNPTVDKEAGEFEDAAIQNVYNQFLRTTNYGWNEMLIYAKQMEEDIIDIVQVHKDRLSGNADIAQIYDEIATQSVNQIVDLNEEWENWSHIFAPRDEHKED